MNRREEDIRLPVIQEEADVRISRVETGRVHVATRTRQHEEPLDFTLAREHMSVERVPVGRPVDAPAAVRHEGDLTIVPVHEERLVVSRQLVLVEELHIRRETLETHEHRSVTLRRQEVAVERYPPDGADTRRP